VVAYGVAIPDMRKEGWRNEGSVQGKKVEGSEGGKRRRGAKEVQRGKY